MSDRTDEQIVSEIEVHISNAITLLKKSEEIKTSALNADNSDDYSAAVKRAIEFQELSMKEMKTAVDLQNIYSQRLISLKHLRSKFGFF